MHIELEAQMCDYNPQISKKSPDRLDACCWALTYIYPTSMKGLYTSHESDGEEEDTFKTLDNDPDDNIVIKQGFVDEDRDTTFDVSYDITNNYCGVYEL